MYKGRDAAAFMCGASLHLPFSYNTFLFHAKYTYPLPPYGSQINNCSFTRRRFYTVSIYIFKPKDNGKHKHFISYQCSKRDISIIRYRKKGSGGKISKEKVKDCPEFEQEGGSERERKRGVGVEGGGVGGL